MSIFKHKFSRKKDKKTMKINKKLKIGLVLSGGGAKAVCHIGALRAFEEVGIKFDYISGTSAGSLLGCAMAAGKTSYELEQFASTVSVKDIRTSKITIMPSKTNGIEKIVNELIGDGIEFSQLKTKFYAVSVCLNTGEQKAFSSGSVAKAVCASCCAPGFFVPVEIDGKNYVDGGILNNLPTNVLRDNFCDVIIAVDLSANNKIGTDSNKIFDTLLASYKIMSTYNAKQSRQFADVVIMPDMSKYKATKIDDAKAMIDEGYLATKEKMPLILEILRTKKPVKTKKIKNQARLEQKQHRKQMRNRKRFDVYEKKEEKH